MKIFSTLIISASLSLFSISGSFAQDVKEVMPGGLKFGMTVQDIENTNIQIEEIIENDAGTHLLVKSLPVSDENMDVAFLLADQNGELTSVTIISNKNNNDKDGEILKTQFDKQYQEMKQSYGDAEIGIKPTEEELAIASTELEKEAMALSHNWRVGGYGISLNGGADDTDTFYIKTYRDEKRQEKLIQKLAETIEN